MRLYVHTIARQSLANGPGTRAVVWVQGCSIGCPGCFNPQTHSSDFGGSEWDPDKLGAELGGVAVDGLTVSGGEPLQQPEAVLSLIRAFRRNHGGTVLLFTGYPAPYILNNEAARSVALQADAVLAGPYVPGKESEIWHNKRLLLITNRISPDELVPEKRLEIGIDRAGMIRMTGYPGAEERSAISSFMEKGIGIHDQG
ncbi:4Fe-4S single cluster domain-containing protein [Cohnella thermotolerans]|jgi:anaerobic ribonucleoside-triphosphate reductase activating protein|uniref:4Fe-4S single cluster domain-containing protein n=1 Tax=Cohnella thermotolerans TaxID=329858 RepID=UPI000685C271|nr:4Fe-4S single cluster domain-containing protein [Cohnella thermotolerans]